MVEMKDDRLTIEHKIVSAKWNAVATEGNVVVVSFDYRTGKKVPIPEAIRASIEDLNRGAEEPHDKNR